MTKDNLGWIFLPTMPRPGEALQKNRKSDQHDLRFCNFGFLHFSLIYSLKLVFEFVCILQIMIHLHALSIFYLAMLNQAPSWKNSQIFPCLLYEKSCQKLSKLPKSCQNLPKDGKSCPKLPKVVKHS